MPPPATPARQTALFPPVTASFTTSPAAIWTSPADRTPTASSTTASVRQEAPSSASCRIRIPKTRPLTRPPPDTISPPDLDRGMGRICSTPGRSRIDQGRSGTIVAGSILLVDVALFHDEADILEQFDVGQRVAANRDQIRQLAALDRPQLVRDSQQVGIGDGGGLNGLHRRHPIVHHESELAAGLSERRNPAVAAKAH